MVDGMTLNTAFRPDVFFVFVFVFVFFVVVVFFFSSLAPASTPLDAPSPRL
jgi:hypothetical protein